MVVVAQLVRASVCGAEGRRFEPGHPPKILKASSKEEVFFVRLILRGFIIGVNLHQYKLLNYDTSKYHFS